MQHGTRRRDADDDPELRLKRRIFLSRIPGGSEGHRRPQMLNLKASESGAVLVSDLVSEYLDDCRVRNLSAQTLEWYARRLPVILQNHWNGELSA